MPTANKWKFKTSGRGFESHYIGLTSDV